MELDCADGAIDTDEHSIMANTGNHSRALRIRECLLLIVKYRLIASRKLSGRVLNE